MYNSIYALLQESLYGSAALIGYQELFLVLTSSLAVLLALLLPFYVVYRLIKLFLRW